MEELQGFAPWHRDPLGARALTPIIAPRSSWFTVPCQWSHPKGKGIKRLTAAKRSSPQLVPGACHGRSSHKSNSSVSHIHTALHKHSGIYRYRRLDSVRPNVNRDASKWRLGRLNVQWAAGRSVMNVMCCWQEVNELKRRLDELKQFESQCQKLMSKLQVPAWLSVWCLLTSSQCT